MNFTTPVGLPETNLYITPSSHTLFLGSCFAERIAQHMLRSALPVCVNPFGTLYNPLSIAAALDAIMRGNDAAEWYYQGREGNWHSRMHSTAFSSATSEECRAGVIDALQKGNAFLAKTDVLVVTFGTAHVFEYKGRVVANCHRQPASDFTTRCLSIDEIVQTWKVTLNRLWSMRPELMVIFTVSPYRYSNYGMHENTLSKSVLHLAVDELLRYDHRILYFPAYEIVMDELRDYRFYAPDMLHVSEQTSDYIWSRFMEWTFSAETHAYRNKWLAICRDLAHRPLRPESVEYLEFRRKAEKRKSEFLASLDADVAKSLVVCK